MINFFSEKYERHKGPIRCVRNLYTNFVKSCKTSKNYKINIRTKLSIKIITMGYRLKYCILYEIIFFFWFIHFNYNLKDNDESVFLIFKDQSKVQSGLFFNEFIEWKNVCIVFLRFLRPIGRFLLSFFLFMKLFFPCEVVFVDP